RLAATRRVLWWDHRGHGDSDAPAGRYGITRLVDDTGIVLQTVAGGPVVLVGHGLGAAVALTVAATYPHLVAAVGCVHGGLHHPRPSPAPDPANHQPGGPSGEDGR